MSKFQVGDVVKSNGYTDFGIDKVTSYTVEKVDDDFIIFKDNTGGNRYRYEDEFDLVSRAGQKVVSVPITIKVADLLPLVIIERNGDVVTVVAIGHLTKSDVDRMITGLFDKEGK